MTNLTVLDKSTHEELAAFNMDDAESTLRVIERSDTAFRMSPWRRDAKLRQATLFAWANTLEQHADELVDLLVGESGKVRTECQREVEMTVDAVRFSAGLARMLSGSSHELSDGSAGYLIREAAGPAAFIVPWNWPLFLLFRDLGPALAAGVTAVVKPAPLTPLATTRALDLLPSDAPKDVVQIVYGDAEVGQTLAGDRRIRVVAFTGSTNVGRQVAMAAVSNFARPILELGGKGASVIYEDADIDAAVATCLKNAFFSAGQICMANTRILVQEPVFERVRELVCEQVSSLRVGHPSDQTSDLGALISADQANRVSSYIDLARSEGSLLLGGGTPSTLDLPGAFLEPAVISGERINPRLRQEEIFGPVVTLEPFRTDQEGLALANDTRYGLVAAVWTTDINRAWKAARELHFGTVWVNRYMRIFAEVPSGGSKDSGMGRTRGMEGLYEFTELKHVNWDVS
ncbi:aldehyde dehydrogenase family protein [Arthrobacter sp. D2-10]